ncbi:NAD(P)/FAD-dependent oxidoreductase [Mycobacteroides abscessus subsp. bolletii]|uniref:flavin-containing monooxygenase n=1 Tax=Mycobacteroides abscessus TaxID=36809 RepID=UPI0019D05F7B|nr:NAD(P)/FAD-dependent oxidoreductase [Mycobacteroides abscessus]MBN7303154.1 NAD(P)/FAD-dependent oxidoreductase [Mycobacteroides abscessus subsp. bolletii]
MSPETESADVLVGEKPQHEVLIIGAGIGGICAGIKLRELGVHDFLIVDRNDGAGGVWYSHDYPDAGCDLPSMTYQFSFARKSDWDRFFAKRDQILEYLQEVADQYGLPDRMRFSVNVVKEVWDNECRMWRVYLESGEVLTARFVISATGIYINAKTNPDIKGLNLFRGKVMHSAHWDHDYDFVDKRVAMIGVGASTMQIAPKLAPSVRSLDLYQRTPQIYLPKPDFRMPKWGQRILAMPGLVPGALRIAYGIADIAIGFAVHAPESVWRKGAALVDFVGHRAYNAWLWANVRDKATRDKLRINFGVVCIRGGLAGSYLSNLNRDNVDLITCPIEEITADGIRTADGTERKVDALVLATGYEVFSDPESYRAGTVIGRDGFDLGHFYNTETLKAYMSTSVAGIPNRFIMVGPYSWTGGASFFAVLETAVAHIVAVIGETRKRGATVVEARLEAQERFHQDMLDSGRNLRYYLVNRCAGSNTYFVNSQNESPYIRPWTLRRANRQATRFDREDYEYLTAPTEQTQSGPLRQRAVTL